MTRQYGICMLAGLAVAVSFTACGSKSGETEAQEAAPQVEYTADDSGDNILRHEPVKLQGTLSVGGHDYAYTINGAPCDTLPLIVDEDGLRFSDNLYTLDITKDGRPFVNRTVAKSDFTHLLTEEFRQKGILDGVIYDDRQQGLRFRVSISFPESDVHTPLLLTIDGDGHGSVAIDRQAEQDE